MTEDRQTHLGIKNNHRSPTKVRRLTPDQLGIQSREGSGVGQWESLQEKALNVAGKQSMGIAVYTENDTASTGTPIERDGASRDVHSLELAVWKAYEKSESPIVNVVIANQDMSIPCGRCLQILSDYSDDSDILIRITDGEKIDEYSLSDLLPQSSDS